MLKETFLHHMKKAQAFRIGDYSIYYSPASIVNYDTDEEISFKNIDDLYENGMLGVDKDEQEEILNTIHSCIGQ